MQPNIGPAELLISCVIGILGLGLPIAILVFLYVIYNKVKSIEEKLNKE
jgi:hypothetical protein